MARDAAPLVEEAARALESGDPGRALEAAESALARDRRSVAALHYRAAALADLGRLDEAREAYEYALGRGGEDVDLLLGAADFLLRRAGEEPAREDVDAARELARRAGRIARARADGAGVPEAADVDEADVDPDAEAAGEAALLEGQALLQLGDAQEALARLDEARGALPGDLDVRLERGAALFELCRFEEAAAEYREVLAAAPDEPAAHHGLGLALERLGDARRAERHLARARALAPDDYAAPVEIPPDEFEGIVETALGGLPEPVRRYLSNVAIAVEDLPATEELVASDPPLSPGILGIFRGAPLPHKASMDPWSHFPSSIGLFQRNLERYARDRDELVEEIRVTLLHEVGHFLGLDEDELYRRGLD
jgi:predicted Zn-dependent protease with MMP-like domain/Flp pilus assembly protein TadD